MEVPLKYYFANNYKECVYFDKYTIDEQGVIRNKATREALTYTTNKGDYQNTGVQNASGKRRSILIGRAIASTFLGPPPTKAHTADHIDRNSTNDTLENIRWLCKRGQRYNQSRLDTYKTVFGIVRDGEEKTKKEWADYLNSKCEKNHMGRKYTANMILMYAMKKQHGFLYKMYPDLDGEVWKDVEGSKTKKGMWRISNMIRVKYVTKYAENVIEGDRLRMNCKYPMIYFNNKDWPLHVVAFMTFFPDEWANKKPGEMVLHKEDDRMDFRPEMLYLGTRSENGKDAHDNGKHDGTLRARQKCASYIDGIFEKNHESQEAAAEYLRSNGFKKAQQGKISMALSGERNTVYKRTWVLANI